MKISDRTKGFFVGAMVRNPEVGDYLERLGDHHAQTMAHSNRVGYLCVDLGYENSLPDVDLLTLCYAGVLHDIGKLRIPIEILEKESSLTKEEREIVDGHPRLGYLILKGFDDEIKNIIIAHHEFKNTNPYPRTGDDRRIKLRENAERRMPRDKAQRFGEIVAVCDLYDALAISRSYKPAFQLGKIEEILREEFIGDPKYIDQILKRSS